MGKGGKMGDKMKGGKGKGKGKGPKKGAAYPKDGYK
jgi:hypothetical protein